MVRRMSKQTIYIASDHRGFRLKSVFIAWLLEHGYEPKDLGPDSDASCSAMEFAQKLCKEVQADSERRGVLICMTGQAMAMTANHYRGIRAALCTDMTMARLAREHNDANVLALGSYMVGEEVALNCLETFLNTKFLGGRFVPRRQQMNDLGGL